MQLTGTHLFDAPAKALWDMLMDADTLARVTPGVSRLERINDNQFKAIAEVKMGPVSGSFAGELDVLEKVEPETFLLRIKQNSKIGNVSADVRIHLRQLSDTQTELFFDGEAKLSGLLAHTGQRVLSGVAHTLSKQFFKSLEEEIAASGTAV